MISYTKRQPPYYSNIGRKSIDPVIQMKSLLIGYLYGITSERRLEEAVSLNLAFRWFCGLDLMHRVPDHSTFSQNRKRRFKNAGIFREIFNEIVLKYSLELYPEKRVLRMVRFFPPMYPGTAVVTRQSRQSFHYKIYGGTRNRTFFYAGL